MAFDPNNPGDLTNGFAQYLQTQGWDAQGPVWQYAQQLRQQGQHPRWDYRHPGQAFPGMGQGRGLGGLAGVGQWPQQPNMHPSVGQGYGSFPNPTPPRPMYPQGIAQGEGLAGLMARRPTLGKI